MAAPIAAMLHRHNSSSWAERFLRSETESRIKNQGQKQHKTHYEAKIICKAVQHEAHSCAIKKYRKHTFFKNFAKLKNNLALLFGIQTSTVIP